MSVYYKNKQESTIYVALLLSQNRRDAHLTYFHLILYSILLKISKLS